MDYQRTTENDAPTTNVDFIDLDAEEENEVMMSDGEIQSELEVIQRWTEAMGLKKRTSEGPNTLSNTPLSTLKFHSVVETTESKPNRPNVVVPECDVKDKAMIETKTSSKTFLATPKIKSVVVNPESPLNSSDVAASGVGDKNTNKIVKKLPKPGRNRKGSTKNEANKSDGSLKALLSKGLEQSRFNGPKQMNKDVTSTPTNVKRVRSADTTPDANKEQPNKLTKIQSEADRRSSLEEKSKYSLLVRRTLNLKVSALSKPLTDIELKTIRQFLIYQIEQALADRKEFIPIFTEPCKIGQDGVYVYCADQSCAMWVLYMVKGGIPEIYSKLVVVPHDMQMQFDPVFVNVRVVTTIPTRRPKDQILSDLGQLNKDLDTDRWRITNIRRKGSSNSTVYMRIDKRSFDTINAREGNKVNWILGPISIEKEVHKARPKKSNPQSETDVCGHTNVRATDQQFEPPTSSSVEGTSVGAKFTKNEGPKPIVLNRAGFNCWTTSTPTRAQSTTGQKM